MKTRCKTRSAWAATTTFCVTSKFVVPVLSIGGVLLAGVIILLRAVGWCSGQRGRQGPNKACPMIIKLDKANVRVALISYIVAGGLINVTPPMYYPPSTSPTNWLFAFSSGSRGTSCINNGRVPWAVSCVLDLSLGSSRGTRGVRVWFP